MAKKTLDFEKRAKLLVCIVKKGSVMDLTDACRETAVTLHFSGIGYGTAKSNYMSYLGLDEIEKRVVYALIPNYCEARVLKAINRRLKLYLIGNGIAFTIPLSGISSIVSNAILSTPFREETITENSANSQPEKERNKMHELVVAVVNQKFTDKVLDCSRAAGATGATILHTRSVNNKQAEQLIGTTFTQETDTIAILTSREYKTKIMEAIRENAGLKTDGGAVLFSLPVDSLIGIGRFEDNND
ncbi:MAG: hypothetical protein E7637_00015 [Ruminococcaceae bacterium]|nr:hypothetical protein [Oscillospiraceae bacterium]